jgi:hypothetical protein
VALMIMKARCLILGLALLVPPPSVMAQRPLTFNVGGGASVPLAPFADGAELGWHALVGWGWSMLMQPLGLRLDVQHNQFPGKTAISNRSITSGTLNLTYRLPMTNSTFSPYLIGGGGAYRLGCYGETSACAATVHAGGNAGLGMKFARFRLKGFVEARWHAANTETGNMRFVPVTFGLTF